MELKWIWVNNYFIHSFIIYSLLSLSWRSWSESCRDKKYKKQAQGVYSIIIWRGKYFGKRKVSDCWLLFSGITCLKWNHSNEFMVLLGISSQLLELWWNCLQIEGGIMSKMYFTQFQSCTLLVIWSGRHDSQHSCSFLSSHDCKKNEQSWKDLIFFWHITYKNINIILAAHKLVFIHSSDVRPMSVLYYISPMSTHIFFHNI